MVFAPCRVCASATSGKRRTIEIGNRPLHQPLAEILPTRTCGILEDHLGALRVIDLLEHAPGDLLLVPNLSYGTLAQVIATLRAWVARTLPRSPSDPDWEAIETRLGVFEQALAKLLAERHKRHRRRPGGRPWTPGNA
jgi:hypothetical protein